MPTKKINVLALMPLLFLAVFSCANFALAAAVAYTPLVRIPGLPATGSVNLSQYMVGIYNFMLSIVGITAVMMLIIGGMRYITAVGSATATSEAKETIRDAFFGLILALLSWVIVSTINPDVLMIKQPGSKTIAVTSNVCSSSAIYADPCLCIDGVTSIPNPAPAKSCEELCKWNCAAPKIVSCIAPGSSPLPDGSKQCRCADGETVTAVNPSTATCETVCFDPAEAVGGKHHCLVAEERIGIFTGDDVLKLSMDTLRSRSTNTGSKENPFLIDPNDNECNALFEGELFSTIYYRPAIFDWDVNLDGVYDGVNQTYVAVCQKYSVIIGPPLPTACYRTTTPKALVCPTKLKITDSQGNNREDILYWGFREP